MKKYILFYSTNLVFKSEEFIKKNDINYELVPSPKKDKVFCGMCICVDKESIGRVKEILDNKYIEYYIV